MWRKNQETSTPAPVPAKPETIKTETVKPEISQRAIAAPIAEATTPAPLAVAEPVAVVAVKTPTPPVNRPAPNPLPTNVDTTIGAGLKIRGEITGSSDMYIDGEVQGKVRIGAGSLTVGSNGRVQADIEAREILVNGSVVGNLKATDRVQLGSTGSVQGSVITPRIGIDDGARLRGNVETARAGDARGNSSTPEEKTQARAMAAQGKGE
jgi:cytoskeletal protein CcmA (bactofilin family)